MEDVKGSTRKKLIGSFYVKNWQHGKLFTVKYFQEMGVPTKLRTGLLRSVTKDVQCKESQEVVGQRRK